MKAILKSLLATAAMVVAAHASAQITFYEHDNFNGRALSSDRAVDDFTRRGFNDRASSIVIDGGAWEVCEDVRFEGRCTVLRPGRYRSLNEMGMNDQLSSARPVRRGPERPGDRQGQITFFERDGFQGRQFEVDDTARDFVRRGFNDQASSAVVFGERWEVCEHVNFEGRCAILRPGRYPDLRSMGLDNQLSSARPVQRGARYDDDRYAPPAQPAYDWRRRPRERLHEARVVDVRAVYAATQQRCWVEREQLPREQRGGPNVGGAVVGGIIGGILGHQVGGGSGRDLATVGGAVAGAAIGSQAGRGTVANRDVQRCENVPTNDRPEFWDVTYRFRGVEHHMQTTSPPGDTVTVNDDGEPRY
jgi:uncharacterized protein YcfJ